MTFLNCSIVLGIGVFSLAILLDIKNFKECPDSSLLYISTRLFTNLFFLIGFILKFIGFQLKYKFDNFIYPILTLLLILCCIGIVIYLEKIRNSYNVLDNKKYMILVVFLSLSWFILYFLI